jgi:hypothetical protein
VSSSSSRLSANVLALEAEKARRLDGVFDEVRIYFQEEKAR